MFCHCPITNYTLVYRYTTEELLAYKAKIENACAQASKEELQQKHLSRRIAKLKPETVLYHTNGMRVPSADIIQISSESNP